MLVAIDVGNTQTVMGLFSEDDLIDQWRLSTIRERTADEYKLFFTGLLRQDGHQLEEVDGAAISSVVPDAKEALGRFADQLIRGPVVVVSPGIPRDRPSQPLRIFLRRSRRRRYRTSPRGPSCNRS